MMGAPASAEACGSPPSNEQTACMQPASCHYDFSGAAQHEIAYYAANHVDMQNQDALCGITSQVQDCSSIPAIDADVPHESVGQEESVAQEDLAGTEDTITAIDDSHVPEDATTADDAASHASTDVKSGSANSLLNDNPLKFFVGGIPPDCWEEDVIKYFSAFGEVKEVQVMKDVSLCRNRGFCFVTMGTKKAYDAIFAKTHKIKNKNVEVREMQPQNIKRRIFVGGVNAALSEADLKAYFSKFGEVEKVTIMRDPIEKRSRGFGFVVFCDEKTVKDVLNQKVHEVDEKHKVEVRAAESRFRNAKFSPTPIYGAAAMMAGNPYGSAYFPGSQIGAAPYGVAPGAVGGVMMSPMYSNPASYASAQRPAYYYPTYNSQPSMYTAAGTTAYGPQR